ncbi:FISUMP domain-containing protein [Agathobaculum sp. LCP25S3_E8]|uniref:FISUMP domain-containing protein n=1 Tax=Agathobaculum sp. LCP25S3_E8 TaxID=3438735 RepID=UPI003F8EB7F0
MNSNTGTFASSTTDNSANFSVTTNNFSGYTLTISGNDDEGKLYDSTKQNFLTSLANATSETDFSSTSNTNLNGQWGYKPSKFNSVVNDNYLPAPTTEASTLDKTSAANTTANDYSISLGLRADYTTTADTYSNSFIITAVPNPIAYVIAYDANTTDTVSNMPASQNSTTSATSITLADKTPVRENYDFKGWCTVAPTASSPDTCTGTTFQPGDIYGIDQTSENITTLYAIWEEQIAGYIQDYTYARCSNEAASKAVKLMDKRDNKVYTVRYINGVCTMIDNLRVDKGQAMTPADTNINSNWTMTDRDLTTGDNSYDLPEIHEGDATTGHWYNYAAATAGTITGSSNTTEATQDICPKGWKLPDGHNTGVAGATTLDQYKLANNKWNTYDKTYQTVFNSVAAGNYYRGSLRNSGSYGYWWSSTANSTAYRYSLVYYTSDGLYSGNVNNRNNGYSVRCVKAKPGVTISFNANGGTGTMDMQKIDAGQSANLTANTFTRTDYVFTGWNTEPDGSGTSYSNQANYTAPASEDNKIVVLYTQWAEISLQNYTKALCQAEASSAPAELTDSRDGNSYRVKYINGLCTMIDNLRLAPGKTITSADSNVSSNYTIPSGTSFNSYTVGSAIVSSNTTYGGYYNYCAATAGTICQSSTKTEATYDICPKGWRLPAGGNTSTGYEQKLLTNNVFNSWQSIGTFDDSFKVAAGYYSDGSLYRSGSSGYWWSSTASNTTSRYNLYYATSGGLYSGNDGYGRACGLSVRCVLK